MCSILAAATTDGRLTNRLDLAGIVFFIFISFQLLLEYDDLSWKEREWFSVYSPNCSANFPQSEVPSHGSQGRSLSFRALQEKRKELEKLEKEKVKRRKKRKTESDSESDEEDEEFQIFCLEEKLTVAHRPNYPASSSTTGTLYPALVS